jgi:hypothetical protein
MTTLRTRTIQTAAVAAATLTLVAGMTGYARADDSPPDQRSAAART